MEATGGYESLCCALLGESSIAFAVINAKRVRDFAKGMGIDAKTDMIDAKVISRFASVLKPFRRPASQRTNVSTRHWLLAVRN